MPQESLFEEMNVSVVRVIIRSDKLTQRASVSLYAETRAGTLLASSAVVIASLAEADLVPAMLTQVGLAWIGGSAKEIAVTPAQWFRSERSNLNQL